MKKIIFVNPETFEETIQEFEECHYKLATDVKEFVQDRHQCINKSIGDLGASCFITDLISDQEGKKLMIGIVKKRKEGQIIAEKFRITIEKICDGEF